MNVERLVGVMRPFLMAGLWIYYATMTYYMIHQPSAAIRKQIINVGLHSKQTDLKYCENYGTADVSKEVLLEAWL